jgi:putative ABC transport system permease protein
VNESFARRYWPGRDPVGLSVDGNVVAGVVKDSRLKSLWEEPAPHAYRVLPEPMGTSGHLLVRTTGDAARALPAIREALVAANPNLDASRVRTMRRIVDESLSDERLTLTILAAFASAALALAAVGVYGVTSFAVAARTRELGIRSALGARPKALLVLVLRQAMGPVTVGLLAGLAGAAALGRVVAGLFHGITPGDPPTVAAVVAVLGFVATAACLAPAVRATRVDPMAALRHE